MTQSDEHARRTSHADQNAVVRFVKNWLSIWKRFLEVVLPYAAAMVGVAVGLVVLSLYILIPMFAYGVYLFGINGVLSSEFTGNQGIVVLVLEVLWVSLSVTTVLAAFRTFKGDSSD